MVQSRSCSMSQLRQCLGCGITRVRADRQYCSRACYDQTRKGDIASRTRTCPKCGRQFVLKPPGYHQDEEFCGRKCRIDYGNEKAQALRDAGLPLVTVTESVVQCMICGKEMSQIGTHMRWAHGLAVRKKMTLLERQQFYGLPRGSRLHSGAVIAGQRERGLIQGGNALLAARCDPRRAGAALRAAYAAYPDVGPSEAQRAAWRNMIASGKHGSISKHINACTERKCEQCGAVFYKPRHMPNRFCSTDCAHKFNVGRKMPADAIARTAAGIRAVRAQKYWTSHSPESRVTVKCLTCGKDFTAQRAKKRRYCSPTCSNRDQVRRKQEAHT